MEEHEGGQAVCGCAVSPGILLTFLYPNNLTVLFTSALAFHVAVSTSEANRLRALASLGKAGGA